jgi:nucleotide-binding universal stress UspA family protein
MGTHGLGGVRKLLLGSTTEHVLRRTRTPVLAVPPIPAAHSDRFEAAVLAAIDFSESSAAAGRSAAQFAQQFNVPLLFAHVVEPVTVPPQWSSLLEESDEARMAEARVQLKALADQCAGTRTVETVVTFGRPADAITALAEERRAGLIVMGLTGEHGLFSRRPGSIAYRVLCSVSVPVLVVPSAAVNA